MFLKHYAACSDKRLVDQLNGNFDYQFFCSIFLGSNRLTNYKIVSAIRSELGYKLTIDKVQQILYDYRHDVSFPKEMRNLFILLHQLTKNSYPFNVVPIWKLLDEELLKQKDDMVIRTMTFQNLNIECS